MPDRLHWNTVKPILKEALTKLMQEKLFDSFRLVGGTSLSLQLGHRVSDDIDLFTDEPYGSLDFTSIKVIRQNFLDFERANEDFTPICLRGKHWELIKLDFVERYSKIN